MQVRKEVRRFVLSSTGNYKWAGARSKVSIAVFNKSQDALGFWHAERMALLAFGFPMFGGSAFHDG